MLLSTSKAIVDLESGSLDDAAIAMLQDKPAQPCILHLDSIAKIHEADLLVCIRHFIWCVSQRTATEPSDCKQALPL